jgi:CheY-like chemotaxis protein
MRILIAEDEPLNQRVSRHLMESWGFDCDLVSNGKDAVKSARMREGQYDLCLMDVEMPVMDGLEATRKLRQEARYLPILAYSSCAEYRDLCLLAGMDDFVQKPCAPARLLEKVRELTVKPLRVVFENGAIFVEEEMPMDQKHAEEVRELAKKDLRKVKLFDSPGSTVIVHKNVTNKISHDFNVKKQLLTTFINRDPERPTRCELYKESNYFMPQTYLTEEEYAEMLRAEDGEVNGYASLALKGQEDSSK